MSPPDRLLTIEAVCNVISMAKSSVYELVRLDPSFPKPIKIGNRSRWSEAQMLAWIDRKVSSAAQ